jgi:hypothetical protein
MKKLFHLDHQIDCKERPQHFYFLNHLKKKYFANGSQKSTGTIVSY